MGFFKKNEPAVTHMDTVSSFLDSKQNDLLIALTTITGDMVVQIGVDNTWLYANKAALNILKLPHDSSVVGLNTLDISKYNPAAGDLFCNDFLNQRAWSSDIPITTTATYSPSPGIIKTYDFSRAVVLCPDGKPSSLVIVGRDITALHNAVQAVSISELYAQAAMDALPASICVLDQKGWIVHQNEMWRGLPGWKTSGKEFYDANYLHLCRQVGLAAVEHLASGVSGVLSGRTQSFIYEYCYGNVWWKVGVIGCVVGRDFFAVVIHEDITGIKTKEDKILYEANHDRMTGLLNRTCYESELSSYGDAENVGVIMVDLDGLKTANDNFGHDVGDDLIKSASLCLRRAFRGEDKVFRLGGDEFAALVINSSEEALSCIIKRIRQEESRINRLAKNKNIVLKMSIGGAVAVKGSLLPESIKKADQRMYLEKRAGKYQQ